MVLHVTDKHSITTELYSQPGFRLLNVKNQTGAQRLMCERVAVSFRFGPVLAS